MTFRYSLLSLLLIPSLLLLSCTREGKVESFSLSCNNPGVTTLHEKPDVKPASEGTFLFDSTGKQEREELSTPFYTFEHPVVPEDGNALYLHYASEVPSRIRFTLDTDANEGKTIDRGEADFPSYPLPVTYGADVNIALPLEGAALASFRIVSEVSDAEAGDFRLKGLELAPLIRGAELKGGRPRFALGLEGWESLGLGRTQIAIPDTMRAASHSRFAQSRIEITYSYDGALEGPAEQVEDSGLSDRSRLQTLIHLSSSDPTERICYRHFVQRGTNSIYLYSRMLDFVPRNVEISLPYYSSTESKKRVERGEELDSVGSFSVQSVKMERVPMFAQELLSPLPADMETVFEYEEKHWRRSDWELFSWDIYPKMLIFLFDNYAIQARFLKRLAFFVEKEGFSGELHKNELIGDLHGWNAHDYRAEDLARFFNRAEEEGFELNREELILEDILVENGILERNNGVYVARAGGLISYSRESSRNLQYLFLTHEGAHGLYFISREFRDRVSKIWASLSETEMEFWRRFLQWRKYNVEDQYLLENEFQAYLLQQDISYVDTYFKDYIIPRYLSLFPEEMELMETLLEAHPEHFRKSTRLVSEAVEELFGVKAGDLRRLKMLD